MAKNVYTYCAAVHNVFACITFYLEAENRPGMISENVPRVQDSVEVGSVERARPRRVPCAIDQAGRLCSCSQREKKREREKKKVNFTCIIYFRTHGAVPSPRGQWAVITEIDLISHSCSNSIVQLKQHKNNIHLYIHAGW
jgi:hypothetical protein